MLSEGPGSERLIRSVTSAQRISLSPLSLIPLHPHGVIQSVRNSLEGKPRAQLTLSLCTCFPLSWLLEGGRVPGLREQVTETRISRPSQSLHLSSASVASSPSRLRSKLLHQSDDFHTCPLCLNHIHVERAHPVS